jgi:hypothetical protein
VVVRLIAFGIISLALLVGVSAAAIQPVPVKIAFAHARSCLLAHGAVRVTFVKRIDGGEAHYPRLTSVPSWSYGALRFKGSATVYVASVEAVAGPLKTTRRRAFYSCTVVAGVHNVRR